MNTTGMVMTVTDELLADLEEAAYSSEFGVVVEAQSLRESMKELRRLRAENAELAKDAGRYRWLRIASAGNDSAEPHGLCVELWDTGSGHEISGADLDTSIDTAMATQ